MDRNDRLLAFVYFKRAVALRKESVDRNVLFFALAVGRGWSLSARRAWIEIFDVYIISPLTVVSLSARRAWIEMVIDFPLEKFAARRSPQGERG